MRAPILAVIAAFALTGCATAPPQPEPVEFNTAGAFIFTAQPSEADLVRARDEGVTLVINTRTQREVDRLGFDEAEAAAGLGLEYVHIPMGGNPDEGRPGYTPEQVEAFTETMAAWKAGDSGKVLLHCASGGRARLLWMAHLIQHEGYTPQQAQEAAEAVGHSPPTLEKLLGRDLELRFADEGTS